MMPNSAGGLRAGPRDEFPIITANLPAGAGERRVALILIVFLLIVFMAMTPVASVQLNRVDAFVPVLQTVVCVADLVTAILLLAQYSIQTQFGLLAMASGYIFSGLFAFLQTLAFPGAYAPNGLIGDPLSSAGYLFCWWHIAFPAAAIFYALSKDGSDRTTPGKSAAATIGLTVAGVLAVIAAMTWLSTAGAKYLPNIFINATQQSPFASYLTGSIWLFSAAAIVLLLVHKRTSLAVWLMVAVFATLPDLALSTLMTSVRYTLGWYTARTYALIASFTILAVILTETTLLYARLANAILLLRRERSNRLMSLDAATAAMAHELRQPLAAITVASSAASNWLKSTPPQLEEVKTCLTSILSSGHRANEIISGVRDLFEKSEDHRTTIHLDDVAKQALALVQPDLLLNQISVTTRFQDRLPEIYADRTLVQQLILNLVRNAIEAMSASLHRERHLRLETRLGEHLSIVLSIQDTGPGIAIEESKNIFEPFVTTKPTGMGLGLSICQTIVQNHGGNLSLARTDSNGCVFEVTLPIAAASREHTAEHA